MLVSLAAVAATLAVSVVAVPTPTTQYNVHEKRERKPLMWEKVGRVDPDVVLPVRIGLTQSNLDVGPGLLDEV